MRRVFPPSDCCAQGDYLGEKHARASRIMMALFILLLSTMPLRAQSERNAFPELREYYSTVDLFRTDDLGACDLGFSRDSMPISTAGNGVNLADNTRAEPLPLHSPINPEALCTDSAGCCTWFRYEQPISAPEAQQAPQGTKVDAPDAGSKASSDLIASHHEQPDRNLDIYYRNRRELSVEVGWHPVNVPFIYDFAVGDGYNMTPLKYTLVPIVGSLRWHVTNVGWRWIFRGNMDFTFSASITAIPRGPETHYYSLGFGIRRNFVYRNWKVVPFFEQSGGAGIINAKEPLGVEFAQGQNLTFTYNLGVGARYNIDSKYSFSAGMNYMHISNGYLSQPQFYNYGINVYGPMFGLDVRFGRPHHASQ